MCLKDIGVENHVIVCRDKKEKHEWEGNEKGLLECEGGGGGVEKEVNFSISTNSRRFVSQKLRSLIFTGLPTKNETVQTTLNSSKMKSLK